MRGHKNKKFVTLSLVAAVGVGLLVGARYSGAPAVPDPPRILVPSQKGSTLRQKSTKTSRLNAKDAPAGSSEVAPITPLSEAPAKALPAAATTPRLRLPLMIGDTVYPNLPYTAQASTNDAVADQPWEQAAAVTTARATPIGSYAPKVAVIDSGIALGHQDLAGTWITNEGESGATQSQAASRRNCSDRGLPISKACNNIDDDLDGVIDNETGATTLENLSQLNCTDQGKPINKSCNNIDDDGNGLIDDYTGYDFVNSDRSVLPGETSPNGNGVSHGTLVSGVIAATNNNNLGIAGVSPNAKILPLQALSDDGSGYTLSVADAIYYAVQRGVDVINLSLGSNAPDDYLKQAINYANKQGIVVVAAAGNDGCGCNTYPAAYSAAIAVGAVDASQITASFSNWGDFVDITAPGVNLFTTSWSASNKTSRYSYASGTSLSTPVVTGAVARLLSYKPDASPLQTKALLYERTNQSKLPTGVLRDKYYGFGLIDMRSSVQRATMPVADNPLYSFYAIRNGREANQPWGTVEYNKATTFYQCDASGHAGLTVYELNRGSDTLYSASEVDRDAAAAAGYSASRLADWCVLQDGDQPLVRSMNIYAELKNTYPRE